MTTLTEAINLLERFLSGDVGDWEWDDLLSVRSSDPEVEALRRKMLEIEKANPPEKAGYWCSEVGFREMRRAIEAAKAGGE